MSAQYVCAEFNVPLNTQYDILETSLSRQSTALVLTTKQQPNNTKKNKVALVKNKTHTKLSLNHLTLVHL